MGRLNREQHVATTLLASLVQHGLGVEQGVLCVIDGAKALSRAIREVLGAHTPVQRCVRHKERNALDHLPERDRPPVKRRCNRHGRSTTTPQRVERLRALAAESTVAIRAPRRRCARASTKTLTVIRLGVRGALRKTLEFTSSCESMIETVRRTSRNVKRWQNGEMCLRWTRPDARSRAAVPARDCYPKLPAVAVPRHRPSDHHRHVNARGRRDRSLRQFTQETAAEGSTAIGTSPA